MLSNKLRQRGAAHAAELGKVLFLLPVNGLSGGMFVVYKYAQYLTSLGYEITCVFSSAAQGKVITSFPGANFPTAYLEEIISGNESYDIVIATWWKTFYEMFAIPASRRLYFCQSDERRFYDEKDIATRSLVEQTYRQNQVPIVCVARWMVTWLRNEFGHNAGYLPNGLDTQMFNSQIKPLVPKTGKIRLLIEGAGGIPFKGLEESFAAVNGMRDIDIWLASSDGVIRRHWQYDRLFIKQPLSAMPGIYASCDLLLKLSRVESFCYPPLEMMACGGVPIIRKVTGIEEYAIHGRNCLIVDTDASTAIREAVWSLVTNAELRGRFAQTAVQDAASFDWTKRYPEFFRILTGLKGVKRNFSERDLVSLGRFFQTELMEQIGLVKQSFAYRIGNLLTSKLRKIFHWIRGRPILARLFSSSR